METGEAEITTFAQSHVLMDMFGSEESFNAMVADGTPPMSCMAFAIAC